jgi:hypothetical protein
MPTVTRYENVYYVCACTYIAQTCKSSMYASDVRKLIMESA